MSERGRAGRRGKEIVGARRGGIADRERCAAEYGGKRYAAGHEREKCAARVAKQAFDNCDIFLWTLF